MEFAVIDGCCAGQRWARITVGRQIYLSRFTTERRMMRTITESIVSVAVKSTEATRRFDECNYVLSLWVRMHEAPIVVLTVQ